MDARYLQEKYDAALSWDAYLTAAGEERAAAWRAVYDQLALDTSHRKLLGSFVRSMKLLCLSGSWCGDCAQQGPMLHRIAEGSDCVELRWLERDEHMDLADRLMINAGHRVPVLVLMAEDHEPVSIMGDRVLSRYRALLAREEGAVCDLPGSTADASALMEQLQEWLNEIERVQLLLRTSTRLRVIHGD